MSPVSQSSVPSNANIPIDPGAAKAQSLGIAD